MIGKRATTEGLLSMLPPFKGHIDYVVHGDQSTDDILNQVLNAHCKYKADYDMISKAFGGKYVLQDLFQFCRQNLKYRSERGVFQSTRSPGGVLLLSDLSGVDCKHYSGFIAGVLDALNRTGQYNFEWFYRFCRYNPLSEDQPDVDHVFIVVIRDGKEIWIDPAPILIIESNQYINRSFDDRQLTPVHCEDYTPNCEDMSLVNISGPVMGTSYKVVDGNEGDCVGCASRSDYPVMKQKVAGSIGVTSPLIDPSTGYGNTGNDTVDGALGAASQIADLLPAGGLKDFLNTFLKDPVGSIVTLIKGKTYTWGTYALGEIYMRNILGYSQIESRQQVPDSIIIQAETFWTVALGVLIGSNDHLDQLAISPEAYWNWNIDHTNTTFEQVQRAHQILKAIGYPTSNRYSTYPLKQFASIPYIYPIPTYNPQSYFTGVHPITNVSLVNGYPETVTPAPAQSPSGTSQPGNTPGAGTTPVGTPTPDKPGEQKAGFNTIAGVLLAGLAVGVLMQGNKKTMRKRKRR